MRILQLLKFLRRRQWFGAIEYFIRPGLRGGFQGPFNGQAFRQEIYRELHAVVGFDAVIECGTYRGSTTGFLQQIAGTAVDTIEADHRFFGYSQRRLSRNSNIRTHHDDSRAALRRLVHEPRFADCNVFVYLDAHWGEDLPLREELEVLFSSGLKVVAMVDDFRVPGDDGYGYDDYGPGKTLKSEYLDHVSITGLRRFFPVAPSEAETGCRRGCVVLAQGKVAEEIVAKCRTLWEDQRETADLNVA